MRIVKAGDLKPGDTTPGGQTVVDISRITSTITVKWKRERTYSATYHETQEFELQEETSMAQKVNIVIESDLSGDPDAHTVEFGLDGVAYSIDLTDKEASKFRDVLAKYVGVATQVKGKGRRKAAPSGPPAREIREWAQAQGMEVPERGRIPAEVREAYAAAH